MPGRKSAIDEAIRDRAIGKAWDIIDKFLSDPKANPKEKREIAVKLAVKNIPTAVMNKDGTNLFPKPISNVFSDNNSDKEDSEAQKTN